MTPRWSAALAVLLLAASLPAIAQSTVPTVVVTGIEVIGASPQWTDGMATPTRIRATVHNPSATSTSYTLAYYWDQVADDHYLNGDAAGSTDVSHGMLAGGADDTHEADWTPMPGQAGHGRILAVASTGRSRTIFESPLFVPVHALSASWLPADTSIRQGEARFFRLAVANLGAQEEALTAAASVPAGSPLQASVPFPAFTVEPGRSATVLVDVARPTLPPDLEPTSIGATLRNASVSGWLTAAPPLGLEPTGDDLPAGALATAVEVQASARPRPGALFAIPVAVRNTGTQADGLVLSVSGPHGWGLAVSPERADLDAGEEVTVLLRGGPPIDAEPGSVQSFTVLAASRRAAAGDASAAATVRVAGAAPEVDAPSLPPFLYQGESYNVTLTVHNNGTSTLPAGTMALVATPAVNGLPASAAVPTVAAGRRASALVPMQPANATPHARPAGLAFVDTDGDGVPGPMEGVYLALRPDRAGSGFSHPVGGGHVAAADVRLNATGRAPGSRVLATDPDAGAGPLVRIPGGPLCIDRSGDGRCDAEEPLYADLASSGENGTGWVSPGDLRLTAIHRAVDLPLTASAGGTGLFAPATGPNGGALPGAAAIRILELDGDPGSYGPRDALYLDAFGLEGAPGRVDPGDIRLTASPGHAPGSQVEAGDADAGAAIAAVPAPAPVAVCFRDLNGDGAPQPSEAIYLHRGDCAGARTAVGDVRLAPADNRTSGGTPVRTGDDDLGRPLAAPRSATLAFLDREGDGRFDRGDVPFVHFGSCPTARSCGSLSDGDVALGGDHPFTRYASGDLRAGSRVLAGDPDTGETLTPSGLGQDALDFADQNGNAAFDGADAVYLDRDRDGLASPGDLRLTTLARGPLLLAPFGSAVQAGDADLGAAMAPGPFVTRETDGVLGPLTLRANWTAPGYAPLAGPALQVFVRTARLTVSSPPALDAAPGEALELGVPPRAFQVSNGGNAAEEVVVQADAGSGAAVVAGEERFRLEPGESRIVPVHVALPTSAAPGVVQVRLLAVLAEHNVTQAQGTVLVTLHDLTDPTASFEGLPAVADPRQDLGVAVRAQDDMGVANVTVAVLEGGVQTRLLQASRDGEGLWRVALRLPAGNHTLRAVATDFSGRHGVAEASLRVMPLPPPRLVSLAPAPDAAVAPGAPVRVVLRDDVGLTRVSLRVDGGPARPLNLSSQEPGTAVEATGNLTGVPSGPHRLDLEAVNAAGQAWTGQVRIYVLDHPEEASGPAGRKSPPAAWLLLAVSIALAAVARRR